MSSKIFRILLSASFLLLFVACRKEPEFNYAEGTVGISKITNFPLFEMTGNDVMSVIKGSGFTDPGVKATESGTEIPVTVSGSVNPDEVGLYQLSYSATNKDGFGATTTRTVAVIPSAETPGVDLSGEYEAIGGAPSNAIITKLDQGLYYTTNCWGGGSLAVIPAYFICVDGTTLLIPLQNPGSGRIVTEDPGTYTNGLIDWTVSRLDFPGGPLIINKKWQKL